MQIISVWNKRPMKWNCNRVGGKEEWFKAPVSVPYGQKMAMVIITDPKTKKRVTRHMLID